VEYLPSLQEYLSEKRILVEHALERYLPVQTALPPVLHESMRYSVFVGGKRLRPVLVLMAAELCGKVAEDVLFAAAAIEMIHTYSLVHDDLPAMDDDDLRRGQPTNHKKYGEAVAILAGDALLTLAFSVMTSPKHTDLFPPAVLLHATHELSLSAGSTGMVGGQVLDMDAEYRRVSLHELETIHTLKTGQLLTVALRIGAILAEADEKTLAALSEYGSAIGLAFQIIDDILDVEGDEAELGKSVNSDASHQKATYPSLYGLDTSKAMASKYIQQARASLDIFDEQADYLRQLAEFMLSRRH
jgi:geranylgeranyl diphosphate synthase type II